MENQNKIAVVQEFKATVFGMECTEQWVFRTMDWLDDRLQENTTITSAENTPAYQALMRDICAALGDIVETGEAFDIYGVEQNLLDSLDVENFGEIEIFSEECQWAFAEINAKLKDGGYFCCD